MEAVPIAATFRRLLSVRVAPSLAFIGLSALVLAGPHLAALGGPIGLICENLGHFRLLGLAAAALGALGGLRCRPVPWVGAGLAAAHAAAILSFSPGAAAPPAGAAPEAARTVRLLSANLGWPYARRPADFAAIVRRESPDLVALTEFDPDAERDLAGLLAAYPHRVVWTRSDRFGIALFSRIPFADSRAGAFDRTGLPTVRCRFDTPAWEAWVVHPVPPGDPVMKRLRDDALAAVADSAGRSTIPIVLVGDLNTTERTASFRTLLRAGLWDSRRGFGWSPTWPAFANPWIGLPAAALFAIPLDHVLVSPGIAVADRRVAPAFGSDHLPIVVDFEVAPMLRSPRPPDPPA